MGAASNKCLPGIDLTAFGLRGGTLIVFFPLLLCSTAATHNRVKDIQDEHTHTHKQAHLCSQALQRAGEPARILIIHLIQEGYSLFK